MKQLHINGYAIGLTPAHFELLTGLMPSSKLVRTLIVEDDYEVATVEEAEQLQVDLRAAVDLISDVR